MICRRARALLVERELGLLDPERYAALHRHLQGCAACRDESRAGEALLDDLALLRVEAPFEIDVRSRVMARVAELRRPAPDELPLVQQAAYAAAALLAGIAILAGLADLLPRLAAPAQNALLLLSSVRDVAARLAAPLAGLLGIPFKLLRSLAEALLSLAPLLERLAPLGLAAAGLATLAMVATVVYFVGRDLRSRPLREET